LSFPAQHSFRVYQAAQGTFEGEVGFCIDQSVEFAQYQATRGDGGQFRAQWRNAAGDEINIDEVD
jgi:hypothetical protein